MKGKMETKKPTSKQEEIAALRALVAMDGYFAETFKDDIEKMCQNIINDFAILAGTHVSEEILQLEERAAELEESHESWLNLFLRCAASYFCSASKKDLAKKWQNW
jgi:hypothetical protein